MTFGLGLKTGQDRWVRRLYFTADDLARIRIVPTLGPLAESLLSLLTLRGRRDDAKFGGWRQEVRATTNLRRDVLSALSPARGMWLDLISVSRPAPTMAQGVETVLASPPEHVQFELDFYAEHNGSLPGVLAGLAEDLDVRHDVMDGLVGYHDVAIGPRWSRIQARLDADRLMRSQILLDGGVDGLLESLNPLTRWERPVLSHTIHCCNARMRDVHLDGRGLVMAPSFFLREPVIMTGANPDDQIILAYPIELDPDVWADSEPARALANLLGRTRANVLEAIGDGSATTTQLAGRVGASTASISQHTSVLREAGLITSHRYRNTVHHMLAAPGAVLLNKS
jgi:DNA-binding transcriptional ArsR family regulator